MDRQRMVPTTEEREIPRATVAGLLEAFERAFRHQYKVELLVYRRGDPTFSVERLVPESAIQPKEEGPELGGEYLTPFQMIRQHAELEIQEEVYGSLLEGVARAVESLTSRGFKLTMFVCDDKMQLRRLSPALRVENAWQVPLHEDPDAPSGGLFVVGSKTGPNLHDIEAAVRCLMPEVTS